MQLHRRASGGQCAADGHRPRHCSAHLRSVPAGEQFQPPETRRARLGSRPRATPRRSSPGRRDRSERREGNGRHLSGPLAPDGFGRCRHDAIFSPPRAGLRGVVGWTSDSGRRRRLRRPRIRHCDACEQRCHGGRGGQRPRGLRGDTPPGARTSSFLTSECQKRTASTSSENCARYRLWREGLRLRARSLCSHHSRERYPRIEKRFQLRSDFVMSDAWHTVTC